MQYALSVLLAVMLLTLSGCAPRSPEPLRHTVNCPSDIYAMKRGECIDFKTLMDDIAPYRILFVGDHHDSDAVHGFVAQMIRELALRGERVHLANEWFTPADNALLERYARWIVQDEVLVEKTGWKKAVGYPFESFAPLYHAVRESGGALYGINLTADQRRWVSEGNTTAMDAEFRSFYEGLDLNVSAHRQMLAPYLGHCHEVRGCTERVVRVQAAWDAMMARQTAALATQVLRTERDRLIVFAGSMHLAYGLGVTMRFARLRSEPYVTILPEVIDPAGYDNGLGDYLFLYSRGADGE